MTSSEAARRALSLAVLAVACSLAAACARGEPASRETAERPPEATTGEAAPAETVPVEPLVRMLRRGGYVIYFRHAATDPSPDDADPVVLSDCDTQRNLSAAGRTQARSLGRAIASLEIPIGRVLS
ncbi:MAG: hypothetical protein M3265_11155, partial [Actinomycetota bacterium]|nr:hypothetical protein [Actinomycetota bacterium]